MIESFASCLLSLSSGSLIWSCLSYCKSHLYHSVFRPIQKFIFVSVFIGDHRNTPSYSHVFKSHHSLVNTMQRYMCPNCPQSLQLQVFVLSIFFDTRKIPHIVLSFLTQSIKNRCCHLNCSQI